MTDGGWLPSTSITAEQLAKLKAAGLSAYDIALYSRGQAPQALQAKVQGIISGNTGVAAPVGKSIAAAIGGSLGAINRTPWPKAGETNAYGQTYTPGVRPDFSPTGNYGVISETSKSIGGSIKNAAAGLLDILSGRKGATQNSSQRPVNTGGRKAAKENDPMSQYPDMPDLGQYTVPSVTPQDFSAQANEMAANAYAPYIGAFDQANANATAQAGVSKEALGTLYDKFVQDIAAKSVDQQGEYAAAGNAAGQRATDLGATIGQNYSGASNQLAAQLGSLGLEAAAPQVLDESASDQAWQQSQAAQGGKAQQDYYATQGQGQSDYMRQLGIIQQQQGMAAQSGVDQQLSQFKQNTDLAKSGALSEQAQQAISIANQLADRDLGAQTTNAGFQMQNNQMQMSQAEAQYNAQVARWQAAQNLQQQGIENNRADAGLQLEVAKAGATSAADATKLTDLQGMGRAKAQATQLYGPQGEQAFNDISQLYMNFMTERYANKLPIDDSAYAAFVDAVKNSAISRGADPSLSMNVASAIWQANKT